MKLPILFLYMGLLCPIHAQVGINTSTPASTLDVKGSMAMSYINSRTFQNSSESYFVGINNHYFVFDGDKDGSLQLKDESGPIGRVYRVKNASQYKLTISPETATNTLRVNNLQNQSNYIVNPGDYVEIIRSKQTGTNTWDISYVAKVITNDNANITLYGAKLTIPPLKVGSGWPIWDTSNNATVETATNVAYSSGSGTDKWVLVTKQLPIGSPYTNKYPGSSNTNNIFKLSRSGDVGGNYVTNIQPSKVILTYEYQGTAFSNIDKIYPLLTAGNNANTAYVFQATIHSFANVNTANGLRSRLKLIVSRLDLIGRGSTDAVDSDWNNTTSFINLLITN